MIVAKGLVRLWPYPCRACTKPPQSKKGSADKPPSPKLLPMVDPMVDVGSVCEECGEKLTFFDLLFARCSFLKATSERNAPSISSQC